MGWWKEDEKNGFGIQATIKNQYNFGIFYNNK